MPYPNAVADHVLDEIPILVPEDLRYLKQIAWKRGAILREEPLDGSEARILMIPGKKAIITVSSLVTHRQRKRFGIVHELGHLEMHRGRLDLTICTKTDIDDSYRVGKPDIEKEANQFAACFLMPARFVGDRYSTEEPSFDLVRDVQEQLDVSLAAATLRLIDFSPEPIAAVFSKDGVIRNFKSTPDFDKLDIFVNVRGSVGKNTNACRIFATLPAKDDWRDVKASEWLREGNYREDATIKEWSVNMTSYGIVLTLLWIDDVIEEEEYF